MGMSLENFETAVTENDKILIALFKEKILGTFDVNDIYNKLLWTNQAIEDIELALTEKGVPNMDTTPINRFGNIIRSLGVEWNKPVDYDLLCPVFVKTKAETLYITVSTIENPLSDIDPVLSYDSINMIINDTRKPMMKSFMEFTIPDTILFVNRLASVVSNDGAMMINGDYEEVPDASN